MNSTKRAREESEGSSDDNNRGGRRVDQLQQSPNSDGGDESVYLGVGDDGGRSVNLSCEDGLQGLPYDAQNKTSIITQKSYNEDDAKSVMHNHTPGDNEKRIPRVEVIAALNAELHVARLKVKQATKEQPSEQPNPLLEEIQEAVLHCAVLQAALERLSRHTLSALDSVERKIGEKQLVDAAHEILTATAPSALAKALVDAPQADQLLSLVLEWQSHSNVGVTSRLLYLAAFKLANVLLSEDESLAVTRAIHLNDWGAVAAAVMTATTPRDMTKSRITKLQDPFEHFWLKSFGKCNFQGVLDLLSEHDFAAILLDHDWLAKIKPCEPLPESVVEAALKNANAAKHSITNDFKVAVKKRFFKVGLHRYEQWMDNQSRGVAPQEKLEQIDYAKLLGMDDSIVPAIDVSDTNGFLSAWENKVSKLSLEYIVKKEKAFLQQHVLMTDGVRDILMSRILPVDVELLKVLCLPTSEFRVNGQVKRKTLVVTGESGSGKTLSMLALAREPGALCLYMTAQFMLGG